MEVISTILNGTLYYLNRVPSGWWFSAAMTAVVMVLWSCMQIKKRSRTFRECVVICALVVYISAVAIVTFGTRLPDPYIQYQLVPFLSYKRAFIGGNETEMFRLLCNILLFVPFGILFPMWKEVKNVFSLVKYAFCLTFCIEFVQLITRYGCFETDDMINNVLGAVIGYLFLRIARKLLNNRKKL